MTKLVMATTLAALALPAVAQAQQAAASARHSTSRSSLLWSTVTSTCARGLRRWDAFRPSTRPTR